MKNKIYIIAIIFLIQISLFGKINAKEIKFNAEEIEILKEENLTIANNGIAIIEEDNITLEGKQIKYYKDQFLMVVNEGKIIDTAKNFEIKSKNIEYKIDKSYLDFKDTVRIKDKKNDLKIDSNEINYDIKNQKIIGTKNSKITDRFGNTYNIKEFEYSINTKIIKLVTVKVLDINENRFILDMAFLDLNKNELIAKDINLNFKPSDETENEPRLKGRSLVSNENITLVEKGTFTLCKKRKGCPPWEMSADKIKHDKQKKTINYKNASLKIYDKKVFYFPKFFHPDPTVKRQSGFLTPKLQDNDVSGLSFNLPYFLAVAENKDMTLNPRFFVDDKFLLQSELRQKNKNSNHIADLSQYISDGNSKGHLFYNFNKNFKSESFDYIGLDVQLNQVTDETYLKAYKLISPIITNYTELTNSIKIVALDQTQTLNASLDIYEDLSKLDNDKYEYVPNFSFSKIINESYSFNSQGYYKNYNTNITEKVLVNDFKFESLPKYLNSGIINEKVFSVKNVNYDANNSRNFKNQDTVELNPTFQTNYSMPLKKNTQNFTNIITPKFSIRLSPNFTRNLRNKDRKINYQNIFDLNRLGVLESVEGGLSATYGYEYTKFNKKNFDQKIKFGLANNLRLEENKDLPGSTNLGNKVSDFVGILEYKPNDKFKFDYDFSFKNNLLDTNYELYGFEFYLNNLTTKFSYLNENNSILKNSYLQNETNFRINEYNSLIFKTRENKEKSFTEFYNLIYQYQNDCLTAGIEYNKEYYNDQDLKPSENLFFKISIIPFGGMNSPNLK